MLRDRQARGHIVTYVMLIAVSLLLLAFSDSRPLRDLRGGVNFALAPVQEVGRNYATVRLITDTRSSVAGRDIRTGVTGDVHGNLSAPLDMLNVPATKDIAVGDTVVTNGGFGKGLGSQFPKNIVIGRIIEIDRNPASIVTTALVQAAADLDSLESVLVITDFVPPPLPGATPPPDTGPSPGPGQATPAPTKPKKTPKH